MQGPIVVGIDFSPASRKALDAAAELAHDLGTRLVLVHALPAAERTVSSDHADAIRRVLAEADMSDVVELATEWARPLREEGSEVETVARPGKPDELLATVALEEGAGLIVVGRSGWSAVKRFLLGSTSKDVLSHAPVPVLIVPERKA